jgi:cytochrome P450
MFAFRRDPLKFLTHLAREYGDVSRFRVGPQTFYFLNHPDLVRDVLVTHHERFHKGRALQRAKRLLGEGLLTSEGEHWQRQRRLAQPAFHRQRLQGYGRVMVDYAERASGRWRDGEALDISEEMMRLTLSIVGKTLFDADVEHDASEVGGALSEIMDLFGYLMFPFAELMEKVPILPPVRRFNRARARLDGVVYRIIDERRRGGEDRGDLLSMLLLAEDEEGDRQGMSNEQVRDEAMTLFLAGHETTANLLAWTWYLLARNPEAERRLHAEIDAVLEGGRTTPTVDDLPRLRYTEMVVSEVMRLYPPAWAVGRRAVADHEAGGYHVPANSLILVSQYVAHRDPRFWPDPERFDPERWTPEARGCRPQFAYFPFGGGPRRCVGEAFAWMEATLILATLASRWRMRLAPGRVVETRPRITLRPGRGGVPVTLERRR